MEQDTNKLESNILPQENKTGYISLKFKKPKPLVIAIVVAVIIIIVALFFTKGFFVVATINGSPISRISVIKELEKQGGKQTLEEIINEKLIKTELNNQKVSVTIEEINTEIDKIKNQVVAQGGTLEMALAEQGMTDEEFRGKITLQKKLEKFLVDKVAVTEAEIDTYIKDSKAIPPKDIKMEDFRNQISEQIKQEKFQTEAQRWVSDLTASAKIKYYVNY
jgi:parvulin-like peptidyl-prolyl isomerase